MYLSSGMNEIKNMYSCRLVMGASPEDSKLWNEIVWYIYIIHLYVTFFDVLVWRNRIFCVPIYILCFFFIDIWILNDKNVILNIVNILNIVWIYMVIMISCFVINIQLISNMYISLLTENFLRKCLRCI